MPVFVDSNVIVYSRDSADPTKQRRAHAWLAHLAASRDGRISMQVLTEAYSVMVRKLAVPLDEARHDVRDLMAWSPAPVGSGTLLAAWDLQDRHSISFWDALIVAAAGQARCETLLTEDLTHGETYGGVRVVDPFRQAPPDRPDPDPGGANPR